MNKFSINSLNKKFNKLEKRERVAIFAALIICFVSITYFWLVEPALLKQAKTVEYSQKTLKQNKKSLEKIAQIKLTLKRDPEKEMQAKITALQSQQKKLEGELQDKKIKFINKIPATLTKILNKDQNIKITSIRSLPVKKVGEVSSKVKNTGKALFYQHTLELKLAGDYNAIYEYVLKLEVLTSQFYWYSFNYQVQNYPNASVVVRVFTISEHKDLIHD